MHINFDIFDVLIIDADLESRTKLKQAAREINCYGKISSVSYFSEAMEFLHTKRECDLIFISNAIAQSEIVTFMQQARETDKGSSSSYILVMKAGKRESTDIAKSMVAGFNSMLLEPYSVDSMVEISKLARKIKVEAYERRARAASELVIPTLIKEVDRLAALHSIGHPTNVSAGAKKALALITSMGNEALSGYYEAMINKFGQVSPPAVTHYEGPSKRLKDRMERKAKEEAAAALENEIQNDAKKFD
ncbi:MAG: hypothetical protein IT292_10720 [Deltaproteobacteria bacterium]|nr:hypothetical protein [Deltaproteobacteria bacterium]